MNSTTSAESTTKPGCISAYQEKYSLPTGWDCELHNTHAKSLEQATSELPEIRNATVDPVYELLHSNANSIYEAIAPELSDYIDIFGGPTEGGNVAIAVYRLCAEVLLAIGEDDTACEYTYTAYSDTLNGTLTREQFQTECLHAGETLQQHAKSFGELLRAWQYQDIEPMRGTIWTILPVTDSFSYRFLEQIGGRMTRESQSLTVTGEVLGFNSAHALYQDNSLLFSPPARFKIKSIDGELPENTEDVLQFSELRVGDIITVLPGTFAYGTLELDFTPPE